MYRKLVDVAVIWTVDPDGLRTELSAQSIGIAARLGAGRPIDLSIKVDAIDELSALKRCFDLVFECSGSIHGANGACPMVQVGGTIVNVGLGPDMIMPLGLIVTKEINMIGSFRFDTEFALAAQLIERGDVDVSPLITGTFPIGESLAAFTLASDKVCAMKVQLDLAPA